jgi:hypothetical protein
VRYPDALVTCTPITGDEYVTPNVVVVFEVVSATSGRTDRIVKVREYAAVPSILRYVIVESASIGLTVLERQTADQKWTATTPMAEDTMLLPEIGIEIPVAELYEGVDFPTPDAGAAGRAGDDRFGHPESADIRPGPPVEVTGANVLQAEGHFLRSDLNNILREDHTLLSNHRRIVVRRQIAAKQPHPVLWG